MSCGTEPATPCLLMGCIVMSHMDSMFGNCGRQCAADKEKTEDHGDGEDLSKFSVFHN